MAVIEEKVKAERQKRPTVMMGKLSDCIISLILLIIMTPAFQ